MQKIATETFVKSKHTFDNKKKENKLIQNIEAGKKIRIGYYSADFCIHPVSHLIANLFELHDKSKFDLFGFYFGPDKKDEMLKRTSKAFNNFYDLRLKNDDEIAQLSIDLNIDIAIDLMGFTQRNRFNIFNIGCAPIQINYLGYAGTLGSSSIDYVIADNIVIPESKQKYFLEKIIYLPHTFMINDDSKKISTKHIQKI